MSRLSLHDLIHAIAGAVVDAQDRIQRFQVGVVRRYFDEYDRPVAIDVRLPSMSPDAEEGDERIVTVPLLSLASPHLLGIKEVDIEFEIGLGAPSDQPAEGEGASGEAGADPAQGDMHKILGVDMNARNRGSGGMARVTLKVEKQEPSDGMVRLIQQLDKLI